MNRLWWCVTNRTARKCFLSWLRLTLVALRQSFFNQFNLAIVTCCSTFDQWNVGCETHSVDMVASLTVIKSIQNNVEALVEVDTIVGARKEKRNFLGKKCHFNIRWKCSVTWEYYHGMPWSEHQDWSSAHFYGLLRLLIFQHVLYGTEIDDSSCWHQLCPSRSENWSLENLAISYCYNNAWITEEWTTSKQWAVNS